MAKVMTKREIQKRCLQAKEMRLEPYIMQGDQTKAPDWYNDGKWWQGNGWDERWLIK